VTVHTETDLANAKLQKAAVEKRRQAAASEPEQPAVPAPEEVSYDSGPFTGEWAALEMDLTDVSAGGDALDKFDFDSFLSTDENGKGFDFPEFDGGLKDVVGCAQDRTSQIQMDTKNAPQHDHKRSHSDAFSVSAEHTPLSPYRKRQAVSLPPHTGKVCEPSMEVAELPIDLKMNESSTSSLSGVEALLQRCAIEAL
jgi:hypothetical protein